MTNHSGPSQSSLGGWVIAGTTVLVAAGVVGLAQQGLPAEKAATAETTVIQDTGEDPAGAAVLDPRFLAHDTLTQALDKRAEGVLGGNLDAWLAGIPRGTAFYEHQTNVFANVRSVPFTMWNYSPLTQSSMVRVDNPSAVHPRANAAWRVPVVLAYALAPPLGVDADESPMVRRTQHFLVADVDGEWVVGGMDMSKTAQELWDLGPVELRHGERAIVMASPSDLSLDDVVADADDAARRVDNVWGDQWPRAVLVVVPHDQTAMAKILGRDDERGLEQVAAVTTGAATTTQGSATRSGDRVVVNPKGYAELTEQGRRIVLTHETTHVATRISRSSSVPIWLSEGFCDYVAYRDTGVRASAIAKSSAQAYARGELGETLPDADAFNPSVGDIGPAYSGSWVAVSMLAREYGEQTVVELYRAFAHTPLSDGSGSVNLDELGDLQRRHTQRVLQDTLGLSFEEFLTMWHRELERYA